MQPQANRDNQMSAKKKKIAMPDPMIGGPFTGLIQTLNRMGFVTNELDPISRGFIIFSKKCKKPVLEIGAAYGLTVLKVLEQKVKIIANDADERHLKILAERVPNNLRKYLSIAPGEFPDGVILASESLEAALSCRVFHFFDPAMLRRAISSLFQCLCSGGKAFIIADSPYTQRAADLGRTPIYEDRRKKGDQWPGFFEGVHKEWPHMREIGPDIIHCLDPFVLRRVFEEQGFEIEMADWIDRPDYPEGYKANGRECVGVIARKP